MENYIVEMRHITKRFPGIVANDDVSIQVKRGEVYALLGENGAGKSTLMSMLFGMYEPDRGEIFIQGEKVRFHSSNDATAHNIGMPKTSQIPYERIYREFRSCLDNGQDFIYIAFSSEMSGCCALANLISEELLAEYPGRRGAVIDSRGGSSATGLIVLQALQLAETELPFETICTEIRFMTEHVEHVFSVDDLLWLVKGGRIPKFIGQVGSRLSIHPILDVENGRIILRRMASVAVGPRISAAGTAPTSRTLESFLIRSDLVP